MDKLVRIKSSRYGIEIHLHPEVPFSELLDAVEKKLQDSARFFKGAQMAVSFLDRRLSTEEELQIVDLISDITGIDIVCILDQDEEREMKYKSIVEQTLSNVRRRDGQFYRGTLSRKQVLESETSIVILGDVELGAKVIARGSIVVVGAVYGSVHAGAYGDRDCYVVGLTLQPKVLRIADVEANRQIVYKESTDIRGPKIASIDGSRIYLDPLVD